MTSPKKSSQHVYDYAVIGSGLGGLCIANALGRITTNLILIDGGDTFGGFNRSINTPLGPVNNGFRFLPGSNLSQKSIAFLEMLLMTSLSPQIHEETPVTYEAGGLKPFLGFGDQPPSFYDEISYFTSSSRLSLTLEPHEWTQLLFNNYSGDFSPKSFVTKLNGENGRIVSITINGQKKVQAQNFIYCGPVRALSALMPEDALNAKARSKLSKSSSWTAVCLDLLHNHKVTDSTSVHVLNGTTQDDLGPCVGRFYPSANVGEETLQYSQWMTFVDGEEAEDTEVIGAALKKMKRQIKRAYPAAIDQLKFERILVVPDYAASSDLKLNSNQALPTYPNLWIGSGAMSPHKNILGTLLQAELVCSALGCHPLGAQVELSPEQPAEA